MPLVHPEVIVDGVTDDHNEIHEDYSKAWNRREKMVPCVADGVTVNTAIIQDAHDNATPGDVLVFPPGPIRTGAITWAKALHRRGAGRFFTWFFPATNIAGPLFTEDITIDSGHGIFANYGPIVEGFSINRQGHMAGPCMEITPNSAHVTIKDVLLSGGTIGLDHHGPNATFDGLHIWDASDTLLDMDEFGLELHMKYVAMAANVQDVQRYWRIAISPAASGGLLGGLYIGDVSCRSDPSVSVGAGLEMSADSLTEIPTFCDMLVVDNVNDGGPVIDLDHIQSVSLRGWANGTNGCVRMNGCAGTEVEMRTRGGTHTFEWVGDKSTGFRSDSEIFTGPAYKISTSLANEPDNMDIGGDRIAGATTIGQVTNNPAWLERSAKRTWGQHRAQGRITRREAGTAPPTGYAIIGHALFGGVPGLATVTHPLVTVNSRVRVWRESINALDDWEVYSAVANNVPGVSFRISSTDVADTGGVYWEFLGDPD